MQPNAEAKKGWPPSEARIWTVAVTMIAIGYFLGGLCDVYFEDRSLRATAPGRAGVALGVLLGWGGYHLLSQRALDIWALLGPASSAAHRSPYQSILASILWGFAFAAVASLFAGIITRSLENAIGKAPDKEKAKPSRADHPFSILNWTVEVGSLEVQYPPAEPVPCVGLGGSLALPNECGRDQGSARRGEIKSGVAYS